MTLAPGEFSQSSQSLLLATHNQGKFREFAAIFGRLGIECVPPQAFNLGEPDETGDSFAANAELKARAACLATGRPALADDSGLCVTALSGDPGIYSARWASKGANGKADFGDAMARIIALLGDHPDRSAQFVCVLALAIPTSTQSCRFITVTGMLHGDISLQPRGQHGFGYDPIFIPHGMNETLGECDPARKNQLSHRAAAIRHLLDHPEFQLWAKQPR